MLRRSGARLQAAGDGPNIGKGQMTAVANSYKLHKVSKHNLMNPRMYPFRQPFDDTPYDEERHKLGWRMVDLAKGSHQWPSWMDEGLPATGHGIGINRAHPLSQLKDNYSTDWESHGISRTLQMISQGKFHANGRRFYSRANKAPNPLEHPWLTGEPCPVYGWKVLDHDVIRKFETPVIVDKTRYKPYVAVQEKLLMDDVPVTEASGGPLSNDKKAVEKKAPQADKPKKDKSMMKRLFFWR